MDDGNKLDLINTILTDHVNTWLQWAEAKHGVLLAANAATLFGWGSFLFNGTLQVTSCFMKLVVAVSILALFLSICYSIKSFVPNLRRAKQNTSVKNAIFFGDCAGHTPESYYNKITQMTDMALEQDIAEEIVMNSRIANNKYRLFKKAIICTTISYSLFVICLLHNMF